jgi:hypothetical protein
MKARKVADLAKGLLVDVDGAIAGDPRDEAARHSAAASAAILATRLFGSLCINVARIADNLERVADAMEKDDGELGDREDEAAED